MLPFDGSRRQYLKTLLSLAKAGLLFKILPTGLNFGPAAAFGAQESMTRINPDLSLDQIIKQRLHHGQERFLNPLASEPRHSPLQLLKWKFFSENRFKQYYPDEPEKPVSIDWQPVIDHSGVSLTFINHASLYIKAGKTSALIDPIFFGLPGFIKDFSPLTFNGRPVPDPDLILITHGHYDHLDKKSLGAFAQDQSIVAPLGYHGVFESLGLGNHTQLDWFDTVTRGDMKITLLPCSHWTMRNPLIGPNTALWGSYLIETAQGLTIYISGDTAYFRQFKEIGKRFDIDVAVFNLGAYEPRWFMAQSHMNPEETVQAFQELQAKHLIPVHWGTFRLGDEPVHFPPLALESLIKQKGLEEKLIALDHGRSALFGNGSKTSWSTV